MIGQKGQWGVQSVRRFESRREQTAMRARRAWDQGDTVLDAPLLASHGFLTLRPTHKAEVSEDAQTQEERRAARQIPGHRALRGVLSVLAPTRPIGVQVRFGRFPLARKAGHFELLLLQGWREIWRVADVPA
jgi:hypothetical protein